MKKFALTLTLVAGMITAASAKTYEPVDYVNPLMGTQSKFELSTGNTYPAIAMPWGMNFWTPQTGGMGDGWQYCYSHDKIRGFKQTHQPSPWMNDYGQFSIMPVTGKPVFNQDKRASWFSHKAEKATPYYYRAYLADHDVVTEIAPTSRAAIFRFTFPDDQSYVIVDAFDRGSSVTIDPKTNTIEGYTTRNSGGVPKNFKNYFIVKFDKPFEYAAVCDGDSIDPTKMSFTGNHAGAIIGFKTKKGETVHARVASSFISAEQARLNLKELGNDTFDQVKQKGRDQWNKTLGAVTIEDNDIDKLRTFYSCLYRAVLFPRSLYEYDAKGNVVHYSPFNGQVLPGYMYGDTGFWDTFRALFPMLNLLYPSENKKMQEWLVNAYKESGFLPEWSSPGHRACMVGNNSASVVADAYLKGVRADDPEYLWKAVTNGANNHLKGTTSGRAGFEDYNNYGYVPCDKGLRESVARTLEYAYDDWCIYKLGQALGKPESELKQYKEHALNYKNVFDKETNLMRGRKADGKFATPFNPLTWGDAFTEGNSWHYSWSVFHDPKGLINLMGGKKEFNNMLDSVFTLPPTFDDSYYGGVIHEIREMQIMNLGNYAHGNQPIQHMIYLYDWSGQPWKAQYWTRRVMDTMYTPNFDGYCGDEDNGQTSAWYVFSALGFYPVCPGSGQYAITSPAFNKMTINLENGKKVVINAPGNDDDTPYILQLKYDGKNYDKNYFEHSDLMKGARLDYKMGKKPNTSRGTSESAAPYSFSNELAK